MNHELNLAIFWYSSALICALFFFRPALHELLHENGVRRWKRLLFSLSICQGSIAILGGAFFTGHLIGAEIIDPLLVRYLVSISVLIGVICASLMYRH